MTDAPATTTNDVSALPLPPLWLRPRFQIAGLGGFVGLLLSIWFRTRFGPDLDDFSEWVIKLPAVEIWLFGATCGFVSWWFIGRWLAGPTIWPTLIWGFFATPFGLVCAMILANVYAVPRLSIMLGDFWAAVGFWFWGMLLTYPMTIITLGVIGPIANILWPLGFALALAGRCLHRRAAS